MSKVPRLKKTERNPQDEKFMHDIPHPIHTLLQKAHNRSRPKKGRSK